MHCVKHWPTTLVGAGRKLSIAFSDGGADMELPKPDTKENKTANSFMVFFPLLAVTGEQTTQRGMWGARLGPQAVPACPSLITLLQQFLSSPLFAFSAKSSVSTMRLPGSIQKQPHLAALIRNAANRPQSVPLIPQLLPLGNSQNPQLATLVHLMLPRVLQINLTPVATVKTPHHQSLHKKAAPRGTEERLKSPTSRTKATYHFDLRLRNRLISGQ